MKQIDIRADTMKLAMDQLRGIGSQLYNKQHSGVHTSATVANQIATGDWHNSYAPTSQIRTQTAQTTNKRSAVIVKKVDSKTRSKTSINDLLRD